MKNSYLLLGMLLGHAPNAKAQAAATKEHNEMAKYMNEIEMETHLHGVILDGLQHGNWPWT